MNTTLSYYYNLIKKHFLAFFVTFSIIFTSFVVYSYYAQKIYLSEGTIEVIKYKQNTRAEQNQLQIAIKESSPEDESEILKSNFLINKAINKLGFQYEFFTSNTNKTYSINKEEIPFEINILEFKDKALFNQKINILLIDESSYKISFDTSSLISRIKGSGNGLQHEEIYTYGDLIKNDFFTIQINQKEGF